MNIQILSNVIIPSITGIFFFVYFVYFAIVNHSRAASFFYFLIFLISFSIFLLGRPLQLLLGPHPVQLITVNIRMLIFCIFSITSITVASNMFSNKNSLVSRWIIYGLGVLFALVYVVFNTLGTVGSSAIFTWGSLTAFETLTPAMRPPFYAREVTIVVQVAIGFLLLIVSLLNLATSGAGEGLKSKLDNKIILFNSGIFLFAATFIIGSFTKQWWLYYFFSMFSATLFGAGVVLDIRELHNNYEQLIPTIKEDIIQNVAFSSYSKQKLKELLRCLGKSDVLDTFAVIGLYADDETPEFRQQTIKRMSRQERLSALLAKKLEIMIGSMNYLIIPLDDSRVGIVLNLLTSGREEINPVELFETIQSQLYSGSDLHLRIGIGGSYEDMEDLRTSYYDALNAIEHAEKLGGNSLIHVSNIRNEDHMEVRFPVKEKARLLAAVKMGDRESSLIALEAFLSAFKVFAADRPDSLKLRLYELAGTLVDGAILVGGDENLLNRLVKESFNDISHLSSYERSEKWLRNLVEQIIQMVNRVHKSRSATIIEKAKEIMRSRFGSQLSYKEVAKELFISSSYFQALFKQETGTTFVEYLTELRIEKAKELLLDSTLTITEISFEVGISNPNYFSSIFKKAMGISAKEFRKRHEVRKG